MHLQPFKVFDLYYVPFIVKTCWQGLAAWLQVTRPMSAAAAPPSVSKDSKADKQEANNGVTGTDEGPEVPPVSTLLEFIAWVVLTQQPVGSKAVGDWIKGRGGYLIDELDQVKEAYIRVQVSPLPPH